MGDVDYPKFSVVILTPDCYAAIRRTMAALRAQTIFDQLEVVVVTPSRESLADDQDELRAFEYQIVEIGHLKSTAAARAQGIRRARGAVVALAEEQSFSAPDWAEK